MDQYRITLTLEARNALEQVVSVGKTAAPKLTHARILLLADQKQGHAWADAEIVSALGTRRRTIERVPRPFGTEGCAAARDHRPQPPRPDKIKINGTVQPQLVELAWSDPPQGRCPWTLQLLADELVVLGLLDTGSTVTVGPTLKKTPASRGGSRAGASPPKPTPSRSGAWRSCFRPTCGPTMPGTPSSASTKRASNSSARCGQPNQGLARPAWIRSMSGRGWATS
jgi:hypothetical protein